MSETLIRKHFLDENASKKDRRTPLRERSKKLSRIQEEQ